MIALLLVAAAPVQATDYAWPTTYGAYVSAYFDNGGVTDWSCGSQSYSGHKGTDIAGQPRNTPIYAGAEGTVIRRYDGFGDGYWGDYSGGGFGNHVALYHGNGDTTIYGHMNAYSGLPALDSSVGCLQAIGGIGTSGNSTGLHLHFETRLGTDGVYYYTGWADDPFAGACSGPVSYWTDQNGSTPTRECSDGTVLPPDFCDGKQSGDWCDGDDLVDCQGGDEASRSTCATGCLSMPLGTPDECAASSADFCDGLMDGDWCDGDDLVHCLSGDVASSIACPGDCTNMPLGTPDECAPTSADACDGLMNGDWCDGDDLIECLNGVSVNRDACEGGCLSMPLGTPDVCDTDDTCVGLMNGDWCDGGDLVTCSNDAVASRSACDHGCTSMPLGTPDECAPDPGAGSCLVDPGAEVGAPTSTCNYMDWELSDDGYYVISKFGGDEDGTTWGHTSTCGYLQGHYDAYSCRYDHNGAGCLDSDDQIPFVQGHVDWIVSDMYAQNDVYAPGDVPFPHYFYVAGAQRYGCGAVLRVSNIDTGACVVAYAEDGGPNGLYEGPSYSGRRILDASPAVSDFLGISSIGWAFGDTVYVEWGLPGDVPGQACSGCASTPAEGGTEASVTPYNPNHMQYGVDCR